MKEHIAFTQRDPWEPYYDDKGNGRGRGNPHMPIIPEFSTVIQMCILLIPFLFIKKFRK